jgi:hypothetical protein
MRVQHVDQDRAATKVVKRSDFDADFKHGFVCFEFNTAREIEMVNRVNGAKIIRHEAPDIAFRCVYCQFDTMDLKLMRDHIAEGDHPWKYTPFKNPYGNSACVEIEGIEDYAAFLAAEKGA